MPVWMHPICSTSRRGDPPWRRPLTSVPERRSTASTTASEAWNDHHDHDHFPGCDQTDEGIGGLTRPGRFFLRIGRSHIACVGRKLRISDHESATRYQRPVFAKYRPGTSGSESATSQTTNQRQVAYNACRGRRFLDAALASA